MEDAQLKHHIWWILKLSPRYTVPDGATIEENNKAYAEYLTKPLSEDVINEVNALVAHVKANY